MQLTLDIYSSTKSFPEEERFGLTSQIRRAAVSIPSNIAEGYGRYNPKEFAHFLRISRGSICELDTQLIISKELEYLDSPTYNNLNKQIEDLNNMLLAFIHGCEKNKK